MAIICLLSLLPSISVLANENYITDPATSLRGKSDSAVPTRLQQNGKTITGIVQDALGPIAGANIIVKGTTNGNITDMDGKFMLENVPANATLVISYIGFTPQEIRVGNQTTFNITLQEDSEALDEVVVVGYGVMKKKRLDRSRFTIEQQFDERPQSVASDRSYGRKTGRCTGTTSRRATGTSGHNPCARVRLHHGIQRPVVCCRRISAGRTKPECDQPE